MTDMPRAETLSDRIRALAREGRSRAEIAKIVDRSYQQVRQVLVSDEARARRAGSESRSSTAADPPTSRTRMADRAIEAVNVSDLGDNKSAKIRRYASLGFRRQAIADHLDIKYQFVRNVLVAEEGRKASQPRLSEAEPMAGGFHEPATAGYDAGLSDLPVRLEVDLGGRVQLPREWRIAPGQVFIARKFDMSVVLMDVANASEAARTGGRLDSVVDELIAERRLEAMREFDD